MAITGINTLDGKQIIAAGASSAISAQQALQTSGGNSLQGLYDFVSNNSGSWTGGGGGATGNYVPYSATNLQFTGNTATNRSFALGTNNKADSNTFVLGTANSAQYNSLANGNSNTAYSESIAVGNGNSAYGQCIAIGSHNTAYNRSLAVGNNCIAKDGSVAIGSYLNKAENYSQAFGKQVSATDNCMAIGAFNVNTTAAFVIGNGYTASTGGWTPEYHYSDAFIVYKDGSVSAAGNISANGYEMKPIAVVATSADATGSNILYIVTGS